MEERHQRPQTPTPACPVHVHTQHTHVHFLVEANELQEFIALCSLLTQSMVKPKSWLRAESPYFSGVLLTVRGWNQALLFHCPLILYDLIHSWSPSGHQGDDHLVGTWPLPTKVCNGVSSGSFSLSRFCVFDCLFTFVKKNKILMKDNFEGYYATYKNRSAFFPVCNLEDSSKIWKPHKNAPWRTQMQCVLHTPVRVKGGSKRGWQVGSG